MTLAKAVDFGSMVGAQLTALIDAEAQAAERSREFIETVGFKEDSSGALVARTISFKLMRTDDDNKRVEHTIEIPVLSIVTIPLLTIEEANIEFDLKIDRISESESVDSKTETRQKRPILRKKRLMTKPARTNKLSTHTTSDLSVNVKIAQSDFPLGIDQLLRLSELSITDEQT